MVNEPMAQQPAMNIEGHAAFLYGTANGQSAADRVGISMAWADAKVDDKNEYRERARQELADAAKRSGDHATMKAMHDAAITVTGGRSEMSAMDALAEPAREDAVRNAAGDIMVQGADWQSLIMAAEDRTDALKELLELAEGVTDSAEDDGHVAKLLQAAADVRQLFGLRK